MIDRRIVSLTQKEEDEFRSWINHNACATLVKIVRSRLKESAAKALEDACKSPSAPLKLDAANVELIQAQRFQSFLEILEAIKQQDKPFVIVELR